MKNPHVKIDTKETIKQLTIAALVSNDLLFENLVLKGGNAIQHAGIDPVRNSIDIDFSAPETLESILGLNREEIESNMRELLASTFAMEGLTVIDVRLKKQPPNIANDALGDFWGGYLLEFKVIESSKVSSAKNHQDLQRKSLNLGAGDRRAFTVDISHYEYCGDKELKQVNDHDVFVYSPMMIVCEKIRAICQQMDEYRKIVHSSSARPRARDFFDIHHIAESGRVEINFSSSEFRSTLDSVFSCKKVPVELINKISEEREMHRDDFSSVEATVQSAKIMSFDFYVDYLVNKLVHLHP